MNINIIKKDTKEEDNKDKPKMFSSEWLEDFMIPRNFIDVIFIVICFILMWYALTFDIPNAKVPIVCANYWNKWAAERAALLGGLNLTPSIMKNATPVYNCYNLSQLANITIPK